MKLFDKKKGKKSPSDYRISISNDIYQVSKRPVLAADEDVTKAESVLQCRFPDFYYQYITTLGEGSLATFVRVYMPQRIVKEISDFRKRWKEFFFWDLGHETLSKDKVMESIIIADTYNGDELIFHPSNHSKLYILPQDDEDIFFAGSHLEEALGWLCQSGKFTAPLTFFDFEPFENRKKIDFENNSGISYDEIDSTLKALGIFTHISVSPEEEEERCIHYYLQDCGGVVIMIETEDETCVWIRHDEGSETESLSHVVQTLLALGLQKKEDDS